jgi:hypothetical protein
VVGSGPEASPVCLLTLPEETVVLPGHMDETTIAFEKKLNPFVLEWRMRRGEI